MEADTARERSETAWAVASEEGIPWGESQSLDGVP